MNIPPLVWPRRSVLIAGVGLALHPSAQALASARLQFPRDAGAHPDYATEWWYATGYINGEGLEPLFGFQVTFFRSRVAKTQGMVSKLAARQLIFAHAAITDIKGKKLWHDSAWPEHQARNRAKTRWIQHRPAPWTRASRCKIGRCCAKPMATCKPAFQVRIFRWH